MTMQSSGPISIGQARDECMLGNPINAGNSTLRNLAGAPSGAYAWHYWYGKSYGTPVLESGTQYFTVNYTGSVNVSFGYSLVIYYGNGYWKGTGGEDTRVQSFPQQLINGFNLVGFYRYGNNLTVIARNNSLDGVTFWSSIGDNVTLTNDKSYSLAMGTDLYTFYGIEGAVYQGAPRNYVIRMLGSAQRPQPPAGYVNGVAPAGGGGKTGGDDSCFVAGSLVLMADRTWKQIQTIQAGDMVMGPTGPAMVKRLHVSRVGHDRRLLMFKEDPRHQWSAEHPHWVRQNGKDWWWVDDLKQIQKEIEIGLLGGLKDPNSFLNGPAEFASLGGFVKRTPVPVASYDPDTLVFIPVVEGSPIFVNGYMVSAFVNEFNYDYRQIDWDHQVRDFIVDRQLLHLNLKWIKDYHDYFEKLKA